MSVSVKQEPTDTDSRQMFYARHPNKQFRAEAAPVPPNQNVEEIVTKLMQEMKKFVQSEFSNLRKGLEEASGNTRESLQTMQAVMQKENLEMKELIAKILESSSSGSKKKRTGSIKKGSLTSRIANSTKEPRRKAKNAAKRALKICEKRPFEQIFNLNTDEPIGIMKCDKKGYIMEYKCFCEKIWPEEEFDEFVKHSRRCDKTVAFRQLKSTSRKSI